MFVLFLGQVVRDQELCEIAVDVLGSPSPISLTVSVDVSNTETETVKLFVAYNAMSLTRVR